MHLFILNRNEAGILTARKDLDYIGREELLEALKRVRASTWYRSSTHSCRMISDCPVRFLNIIPIYCSKRAHLKLDKKILVKSPRNLNFDWHTVKPLLLFLHATFQIPTDLSLRLMEQSISASLFSAISFCYFMWMYFLFVFFRQILIPSIRNQICATWRYLAGFLKERQIMRTL